VNSNFLYDPLGPKGRRRARFVTAISAVVALGIIASISHHLASCGQLEPSRWAILFDTKTGVPQVFWQGYVSTLRAAAIAMVLALSIGLVLAIGRLSPSRTVRVVTGTVVEGFRGVPLLLLMLFAALGLPHLGLHFSLLWLVVIALVSYNSSVLCEIFRSGIESIDKGQTEAGLSLGLSRGQVLRSILLPQAVPRMLPILISQMVLLVKDTSLGFIVGYSELLRAGRSLVDFYGNRYALQIYIAVAAIYVATNLTISYLARRIAARQRLTREGQRSKPVPPTPTPAGGSISPPPTTSSESPRNAKESIK
jgi:glutamate transport system permease protein